jgi:transcription-repair coupling factor (superfamily II helicase)
VLSKKEFKTRTILDHVASQAFGFAAALLVRRTEKAKRRVWLLCPDVKTQDHVHAELGVWQCPALYFPRLGQLMDGALADPELLAERTAVLSRMLEGDSPVMVLCADSLDEPAPDLAEITDQKRMLKVGEKLDVEGLLKELSEAGYERVPVVTERGQFARRGGIVDFFSWSFSLTNWNPSAPLIYTISRRFADSTAQA